MTPLICGIWTEMIQMNRLLEPSYGCVVGGAVMMEGRNRNLGMDMYTLLYLKWITNKDLLYSTGNSAQRMRQPGWEGSLGENGYMYMYG